MPAGQRAPVAATRRAGGVTTVAIAAARAAASWSAAELLAELGVDVEDGDAGADFHGHAA